MVKANNAPTNWIKRKLIMALRVRIMFFFSFGGKVGMRVVRIGRWELCACQIGSQLSIQERLSVNLLRMRIQLYIRSLLLLFPRLRLHACARDGMRIKRLVGRIWGGFLEIGRASCRERVF